MKIIDNDRCMLLLNDLYAPIKRYFNLEEAQEIAELKEIPENEVKIMFDCARQAIINEERMIQYIRALSIDTPGRDLMFVILDELLNYIKGKRNYQINHWNLCREFEKLIKNEQSS